MKCFIVLKAFTPMNSEFIFFVITLHYCCRHETSNKCTDKR